MLNEKISVTNTNLNELERIFNCLSSLIGHWDQNLINTYANISYAEYFGKKPEDMKGKHIIELLGPTLFEKNRPYIEGALLGQPQTFERELKVEDGSLRQTVANYIPDIISGEVKGFFVIVTDISKIKQLEKQNRETQIQSDLNEIKYHSIFENSPIGIIQIDSDLRYLSVNSAYAKFIGYSESELKTKTILDITHPEDIPASQEISRRFPKESGVLREFEKRYIHKSGKILWALVNSHTVKNTHDDGYTLVSSVVDITEKKWMQNWNRAVLNGSTYAIIATQLDGTITTFNSAAEKLLGYNADEVVGKLTPAILHDLDEITKKAKLLSDEFSVEVLPGFEVFTLKAIKCGLDINEWTYIHKDGTRFPVKLCVSVIKDQLQNCIGYMGIAEDLTLQKIQEKQILDQQNKLIAASKMSSLGEMAGGIAHEINNPLAIIHGKAENLVSFIGDESANSLKIKNDLQKIITTTARISKIIKGLQYFSRNSDADPIESKKLNLLINESLDFCNERFKNHRIDLRIKNNTDYIIECRPSQIVQVLLNLLNNAHDAVENLSEKWVELKVEGNASYAIITITDSGNGISPQIVDKIMNPFFTTKEIGKGTGLGLSIAKGIIADHYGQLLYDSGSPHTKFILEIPFKHPKK